MSDIDCYNCVITHEQFKIPVIVPECGHTFERSAIIEHLSQHQEKKCPICNKIIRTDSLLFPINWVAVNALNLHINTKTDLCINEASRLKLIYENRTNQIAECIVRNIIKDFELELSTMTSKDYKPLERDYTRFKDCEDGVKKKILEKLSDHGFVHNIVFYKTLRISLPS
jgi:hypothetical protein